MLHNDDVPEKIASTWIPCKCALSGNQGTFALFRFLKSKHSQQISLHEVVEYKWIDKFSSKVDKIQVDPWVTNVTKPSARDHCITMNQTQVHQLLHRVTIE